MKILTLIFFTLGLVIILVFGKLPQTFYQQDEWFGLGLAITEGYKSAFDGVWGPLDILFIKGRVIASLISYFFASYFPLQNTQMAVLAITLHSIATFLVFILIRKFIKNNLLSSLGAVFFAVNAVSHSGVTWPAIAITAVGSTIFVLIGVLFFLKYITDYRKKWLVVSGLTIYLSLWFKEAGLYMFLFLPLSALFFKRYSIISFFKTYWAFLLPFLLIVSFRVMELNLRTTTSNLYITGLNENFFSTILLRSILYPLTSFSLMFVPGDQFLEFARSILRQVYPFFAPLDQNILIAQTVILDLLAVILTFLIILSIILLLQKDKVESKRTIYFWIVFSFMSFLPYIVLSKDFSYLEGRYYYLSVVGGAFILSWFLKRLREISSLRVFYLIVMPLCIFYLMFHASVVKRAITEQVRLSNIRIDFITQLKTLVPTLDNKKNVFYTTGDLNYWADGNKIPFQQGSGFTFMILYNESSNIPKELLKDEFLSEIGSQGYKEISEYGFGYFWDREELDKVIKVYNLPPGSIIELQYNSKTRKLEKL